MSYLIIVKTPPRGGPAIWAGCWPVRTKRPGDSQVRGTVPGAPLQLHVQHSLCRRKTAPAVTIPENADLSCRQEIIT